MGAVTPEMRAHYARCEYRARPVLKLGDKLRMKTHGKGCATYQFRGWNSDTSGFFTSAGGDDELHPYNIAKVNGAPMVFRDPTSTVYVLKKGGANDGVFVGKRGLGHYWPEDPMKAMQFTTAEEADAFGKKFFIYPLTPMPLGLFDYEDLREADWRKSRKLAA